MTPDPDQVSMSWRRIAYAATILAIALGSALTIIVSIGDADALSTIALALAVLAFVAQILIYVASSATDIRQAQLSLQINAEAKAVLAEIRTRTQASESIMKGQFDRVLKHALRKEINRTPASDLGTGPSAGDPSPAPDLGQLAGPNHVAELGQLPELGLTGNALDRVVATGVRKAFTSGDPDPILRRMRTYPTPAEGVEHVGRLAKLTPLALAMFASIAELEIMNRRLGVRPQGMNLSDRTPFTDELVTAGLVRKYLDDDNRSRGTLTDLGREVVRTFRGIGDLPDEIVAANARHTKHRSPST